MLEGQPGQDLRPTNKLGEIESNVNQCIPNTSQVVDETASRRPNAVTMIFPFASAHFE